MINRKSAIEVGKVDEYYSYGPDDLDEDFKEKNKDILSRPRGNGYWLWKSYIINKTMVEKLNEGDYLIYTDAGTIYMNQSHILIDFMIKNKFSIWANKLICKESQYTKRDAFILMGVDMPFYRNSHQYIATIQIYKKNEYSVKFIQEWLYYCQDKRIITDDNNTQGMPNFQDFRDNRHDQSILSLLIKKHGVANSGYPNKNLTELKPIIMPNIICVFRRFPFKDIEDLKNYCKKKLELQKTYYT